MNKIILPVFYFPRIDWFTVFLQNKESVYLETMENFPKQTYRNRTEIYGANGKLKLMIPVRHLKDRSYLQTEISYAEDWRSIHWRSIESAYRKAAFFDFYGEPIQAIFTQKFENLLELNFYVLEQIFKILKIDKPFFKTEEYEKTNRDFRTIFSTKKQQSWVKLKPYYQEFSEKYDFIENLSILDLIFNLGPEALNYLNQIEIIK